MGKTLFAVSTAALMVAFTAGWAAPHPQARVAQSSSVQVDTFEMMASAKQMPSEHFCRLFVCVLSRLYSPVLSPGHTGAVFWAASQGDKASK